jgi:hypothetical protein
MIRKNLFQTTAITVIFLFLAVSTMAQDSYLKNRWNFKLAGAPKLIINNRGYNAFLMAEANYGVLNHIEVGVALGFENTYVARLKSNASNPPIWSDYSFEDYVSPLYNLHLNYHLMPYLVKEKNSRFDVYLTGKLGGAYIESDNLDHNFFWNYYLGGGLSWYFTRYVGIYTEIGKQERFNSEYKGKAQFRFGVAVKF